MEKKLYRDESRKKVAGVCAGLADYFNVDVSLVRAIFLLALILKGGGGLVYIVLWIVLPKRDYYAHRPEPFVDYTVPPGGEQNQYTDYNVPPQTPYTDYNVPPVPPGQRKNGPSTAALVVGVILVLIGSFTIMDEFDIIPNWDIEHFWPIILIIAGIVFVFTGSKKQAWQHNNWNKTNDTTAQDQDNDNPPTA